MSPIPREALWPLEVYARERDSFRARVLAHKKQRTVTLGDHMTLVFEDELTIRYQIQEMLRIERIFEEAGIQDERAAYNPLIPDGCNWKATLLIEFPDAEERRVWLGRLIGVEDRVWVRVGNLEPVWAIADEDLARENGEKTSAVHFLRFELSLAMVAEVKRGGSVALGVDHPEYRACLDPIPEGVKRSLSEDLKL